MTDESCCLDDPDRELDEAPGHNAATRLVALKDDIETAHRAYKKCAQQSADYVLEIGHRLIEAKAIVGHGGFGQWVEDNCPFAYRTAGLYMAIARSGLKSETIANLGLRVAAQAVGEHLDPVAREQRRIVTEFNAFKRRHPNTPAKHHSSPTRPSQQVFADIERNAIWREETKQVGQVGDPTNQQWPIPQQDGELLLVEWDFGRTYIWLSNNAHQRAAKRLSTRESPWSPPKADHGLRYNWVYFDDEDLSDVKLEAGEDESWEQVRERLCGWAAGHEDDAAVYPYVTDPIRTGIAETLLAVALHCSRLSARLRDRIDEHVAEPHEEEDPTPLFEVAPEPEEETAVKPRLVRRAPPVPSEAAE
jgi:hypothetical protein